MRSAGELAFWAQLQSARLTDGWLREYQFVLRRRWRFDFCHLGLLLAVEIEGGHWIAGRHTRGTGFTEDIEKYNAAALLGFRVLRGTTEQAENGDLIALVKTFVEIWSAP